MSPLEAPSSRPSHFVGQDLSSSTETLEPTEPNGDYCFLHNTLVPFNRRLYLMGTELTSYFGCRGVSRLCHVVWKWGLWNVLRGTFLSCKKSKVKLNTDERPVVGTLVVVELELFCKNGSPFSLSSTDNKDLINVEVKFGNILLPVVRENLADCPGFVRFTFTPKSSGFIDIDVFSYGWHVSESPYIKEFIPAALSLSQSHLVDVPSTMVCQVFEPHTVLFEARDEYHNLCLPEFSDPENLKLEVAGNNQDIDDNIVTLTSYDDVSKRYSMDCIVSRPQHFKCTVTYKGELIQHASYNLIVLDQESATKMNGFIRRKFMDSIECTLMRDSSTTKKRSFFSFGNDKERKVYCHLTPKQVVIKEYKLFIIPTR